ncbi:chemotaxis response regulator protein-glutamate methylesterase [Sporosarcina sp. E16_8]|uniref:protein-glutamate methylesterase/protein-glutamine glutaminase n=1 Tax=Sporosarcina sp. E16_8 TaxID=2789295 RepID=UPI001A91700D|nr:chemotaxis response regulator protein-glutamate methylesterase [Sporosarcina sp. E16_8]MBO0585764.1 chemotaxis response regulator protein-glutamate methylesterase [Sporosarcina sp. E16_8]
MNTGNRKKALVVDDSAFMRKLISDFLSGHPDIEVIGTARNGKEAVEKVEMLKPDVVTMDIEMPIMDGLEALQEIMSSQPVPIVMLSSTTKIGAENTMLAMEYGAVDFVAKPGGAISLNLHEVKEEIIGKVIAASGVRLSTLTREITGRRLTQPISLKSATKPVDKAVEIPRFIPNRSQITNVTKNKIPKTGKTFVIIGTSTGGPRALQEVLTGLPASIGVPILIVQHMPPGFTKSLADRLNGLCDIQVKEAEDGELLENGTAYIAPGGQHLKMTKRGMSYYVRLDAVDPPRAGHRPSVDVLLESAAENRELNFLTVIMTGMGYDGKNGMEVLRKNGKTITIAESAKTSVVYGMPKAIKEAGFADEVVDLHDISESIIGIIKS